MDSSLSFSSASSSSCCYRRYSGYSTPEYCGRGDPGTDTESDSESERAVVNKHISELTNKLNNFEKLLQRFKRNQKKLHRVITDLQECQECQKICSSLED